VTPSRIIAAAVSSVKKMGRAGSGVTSHGPARTRGTMTVIARQMSSASAAAEVAWESSMDGQGIRCTQRWIILGTQQFQLQ